MELWKKHQSVFQYSQQTMKIQINGCIYHWFLYRHWVKEEINIKKIKSCVDCTEL